MKKERRWCYGFKKMNGELIQILGCTLLQEAHSVVLQYAVSVSGSIHNLQFSFPSWCAHAISNEVADGVVVMLLPYALRGGYNIRSEIPISSRLWLQLTRQLIPQFCAVSSELWPVDIRADVMSPSYRPTRVATAMSCGVDSFTTFFQYTQDMQENRWKIDLLTFFENGAHHCGTIGHSTREGDVFQSQLDHVKRFCDSIDYPLLYVRSNLDEFLNDIFWQDSFNYTHAFRNAGFVLLLQKEIRVYYYAGAFDISHFSISLWDDTEHYEKWLLPNLSSECTQFFSVCTSFNRIEKVRYISQFQEASDHLLVCYAGGENCGKCAKCVRQLLTLDYLNLLDKYKKSFPVDYYRKEKPWYELQLLALRKEDPCLEEVYRAALAQGVKFSVIDQAGADIHKLVWELRDRKKQHK